jgi:uncharacterized repeat protein (TIGR01451 family)
MERTRWFPAWAKLSLRLALCLAATAGCAGLAESPEDISPYLTLPDFVQKPSSNPAPAIRAAYPAPSVTNPAITKNDERDEVIAAPPAGVASSLKVTLKGPETAAVGAAVTYQITVQNCGPRPATNVRLEAGFDPGLEHETKANPVALLIGDIPAGANRTYPLALIPRQTGKLNVTVMATADGGLKDQTKQILTAQGNAPLAVLIKGPSKRYLGRPAVWDIDVANQGEVVLGNVIVNATLPPEVACLNAMPSSQAHKGPEGETTLAWNLGSLSAGEHRQLQITSRCDKLSAHAIVEVIARAEPGAHEARATASLQIAGLPALRLDVVDTVDPVEIGGKTTYRITVTNHGTLAASNIQVAADLPASMSVLQVNGPVPGKTEARRVAFSTLATLPPGQSVSYLVEVQANEATEGVFRAELLSDQVKEPMVAEESTTIYKSSAGDNSQNGPAVNNYKATPSTSGARLTGRPDRFRDRFQKRE